MTDETMIIEIARTLGVRPQQVQAALSLLDEGNTIPFIARYRKEATGTLDEVQLRCIQEQLRLRTGPSPAAKKRYANRSKTRVAGMPNWKRPSTKPVRLQEVEDIYLPYKP